MFKFITGFTAAAGIGLLGSGLFVNDIHACGDYGDFARVVVERADNDQDEAEDSKEAEPEVAPKIQLAILLDTSGSMDGLIDQARSQLWKIVNEFATVKQDGETPDVEVALYEYGNDRLPSEEGFLRMIVPLTSNLDRISEELFALTTNGGSEYCGYVIDNAVKSLQWSTQPGDYKAVFVAGNEPFTQGEVNYEESCKAAIENGVIVNTIHCGDYQVGVNTKWLHGAQLADGSYMAINGNARVLHIESPYDDEIVNLGKKLNDTYIPWGEKGKEGAERQAEQDANAAGASGNSDVDRAIQKKNHTYRNDSWDLIDAIEGEKVKLDDVKKEDLPEELRKLSLEELTKHIEKKKEKRAELSKKLDELEKKRNKHVAEKREAMAEDGEETLDDAMIKAIRKQAEDKNFKREVERADESEKDQSR